MSSQGLAGHQNKVPLRYKRTFVIVEAGQPFAKIASAKSEGILEAFDALAIRLFEEGIDLEGDDILAKIRDDTPTPETLCS